MKFKNKWYKIGKWQISKKAIYLLIFFTISITIMYFVGYYSAIIEHCVWLDDLRYHICLTGN